MLLIHTFAQWFARGFSFFSHPCLHVSPMSFLKYQIFFFPWSRYFPSVTYLKGTYDIYYVLKHVVLSLHLVSADSSAIFNANCTKNNPSWPRVCSLWFSSGFAFVINILDMILRYWGWCSWPLYHRLFLFLIVQLLWISRLTSAKTAYSSSSLFLPGTMKKVLHKILYKQPCFPPLTLLRIWSSLPFGNAILCITSKTIITNWKRILLNDAVVNASLLPFRPFTPLPSLRQRSRSATLSTLFNLPSLSDSVLPPFAF